MMACPYGIPRYDWDSAIPYIRKCIFCFDRIAEGKQPACTEACPTGATIFGKREDLLEEARNRVAANSNLRLYGDDNEIGGTSVLYVTDLDLSFLSFGKDLREKDAPPHATAPYLNSIPFVAPSVFAASLGVYWIIQRRMENQTEGFQEGGQDE
jgi:formate dehydrogenase iron-sulfur subunit